MLIVDTPETCVDCRFCYEFDEGIEACCSITDDDKDKREYRWYDGDASGWNNCLRRIIGEDNNE